MSDTERALVFHGLRLEVCRYGEHKGKVTGSINFGSKAADVSLNLTHEHCDLILKVVGGALVESAREVADLLTRQCIEAKASVSAIEDAKP